MELPRLTNYLAKLAREEDSQTINKETFKLEEISQADGVKTALKIIFNQKY